MARVQGQFLATPSRQRQDDAASSRRAAVRTYSRLTPAKHPLRWSKLTVPVQRKAWFLATIRQSAKPQRADSNASAAACTAARCSKANIGSANSARKALSNSDFGWR